MVQILELLNCLIKIERFLLELAGFVRFGVFFLFVGLVLYSILFELHNTSKLFFELIPGATRAAPEAIVQARCKLDSHGIHICSLIIVMLVA